MKHQQQTIFILSAERDDDSPRMNYVNTQDLARRLNALELLWMPVEGCYKGAHETSFMVIQRPGEQLQSSLWELSQDYNQESILVREPSGATTLVGSDWSEYIGQWRPVPEPVAKMHDAWTKRNGQYYIVTKH
jgi:hypothetical protein